MRREITITNESLTLRDDKVELTLAPIMAENGGWHILMQEHTGEGAKVKKLSMRLGGAEVAALRDVLVGGR